MNRECGHTLQTETHILNTHEHSRRKKPKDTFAVYTRLDSSCVSGKDHLHISFSFFLAYVTVDYDWQYKITSKIIEIGYQELSP